MEEKRKIAINYLKKLKQDKKIEDYGFEKWSYWDNVPYIEINGKQVFLAKTFYYLRNLCIKTIFDYKSKQGMENFVKKCIEENRIITDIF